MPLLWRGHGKGFSRVSVRKHRVFMASGSSQSATFSGLITCCLTLCCLLASACNGGGGGGGQRVIVECGGGAEFACPSGTFCDLGSSCGGFDSRGECRFQPTNCPADSKLVCGCDRKTYASACYAAASGVSLAYNGSCIKEHPIQHARKKLEFPEPSHEVDGSSVENAGDQVNDQYQPLQ